MRLPATEFEYNNLDSIILHLKFCYPCMRHHSGIDIKLVLRA